nr:hypothetical protein [Arsenophonus endosymbiont of Aleurodicus floccissimus]
MLLAAVRQTGLFIGLYFLWRVLLDATTPALTALISRTAAKGEQSYVLGLTQSISQFASIAGIAIGYCRYCSWRSNSYLARIACFVYLCGGDVSHHIFYHVES